MPNTHEMFANVNKKKDIKVSIGEIGPQVLKTLQNSLGRFISKNDRLIAFYVGFTVITWIFDVSQFFLSVYRFK